MTNGKVEFYLSAEFELDYEGRFSEHDTKSSSDKLQNMLEKWMQSYMDAPDEGLKFKDNEVTGETYLRALLTSLSNEIKEFLKMECY